MKNLIIYRKIEGGVAILLLNGKIRSGFRMELV